MLNLARKWRSKQFDEIVGQNLSVRLIKNSLYRNLIFPVYLFSGPRGCGKTSMARLFAAALNCEQLEKFQKDPQNFILPCLSCKSCIAMRNFSHPDFIEIDAASNTGVDNVRQIIDSASFVPILSTKKIYLIDEAHMLSKAAFNALLKILEEPPKSVVFMLATTDLHKIIETVKSRCFQLLFDPILPEILAKHLEFICLQENIPYEFDALLLISRQAEGSARDAINLLERIRLINNNITNKIVLETIGYIDDQRLFEIFNIILSSSIRDVLNLYIKFELEKLNPSLIFKRLIDLIKQALLLKNGLDHEIPALIKNNLNSVLLNASSERLINMLDICYTNEFSFSKSSNQHNILQMILIKLAQSSNASNITLQGANSGHISNKSNINNNSINAPRVPEKEIKDTSSQVLKETKKELPEKQFQEFSKEVSGEWGAFLVEIQKCNDQLVLSIFKQAKFASFDKNLKKIKISFNSSQMFYKDWLESSRKIWQPILDSAFLQDASLEIIFENNLNYEPKKNQKVVSNNNNQVEKPVEKNSTNFNLDFSSNSSSNIVDIKKSEKANILLKIFPGTMSAE